MAEKQSNAAKIKKGIDALAVGDIYPFVISKSGIIKIVEEKSRAQKRKR